MTQKPNEARMAAWRAFLHTYATVIPALEREMQEDQNLTLVWYDILAQLSDSPEHGRLRMQDLSGSGESLSWASERIAFALVPI